MCSLGKMFRPIVNVELSIPYATRKCRRKCKRWVWGDWKYKSYHIGPQQFTPYFSSIATLDNDSFNAEGWMLMDMDIHVMMNRFKEDVVNLRKKVNNWVNSLNLANIVKQATGCSQSLTGPEDPSG